MITIALQSGSNGNAIYVEAAGVRLLFDAGISGRQAGLRLQGYGHAIRAVDALLLSHAHADHTRCAGVYHRLFGMPIHTTAATHKTVARYIGKLRDVRCFAPGQTLTFGDVQVHAIPTPHDATDSVAFVVEHDGRRLGILTDLGHRFPALCELLPTLDAVYLESNYDPQLLADGSYPPELKARIRGDAGHLSNHECAALLQRCDPRRLRWAALAHLSQHNNHPELALQTSRALLGDKFPLTIAPRFGVSDELRV